MSVTEYEIFDPRSGLASRVAAISPSPLALLGPFSVTSATLGLTTGVPLVKLPVGAVIYDIGIFVTVGWDGTTPKMDVGSFSSSGGVFDAIGGGAVELGDAITAVASNDGLLQNQDSESWLAAAIASNGAGAGDAFNPPALYVSAVTTILAVVSQDGTKGGTATGATTGTALVYVLVATPFIS
jgi:hypothetical protein